ncbi:MULTISPECIES: XdhC/CoxI family protein [unclassified Paenibacillus]|uniref:XdhC family protein n=1 Tax=unclassified Paenibacillus TaxID=185978 RepID=UPI001AE7CB1B|nr:MULTISPECIES: XdhC/CoxI family protein [unclassified Paenibacillus]MBP1154453.1 xanthine dehydrogenase accessory factor [Paenibacillus sp. PvP091]MBP1170163.1 xanthine dehydrogenase accessory factor [Paenibacillus sp. PvR098]MBP2441191.1 xanthine dehydrogenase accessory factor [Paenibacillus sp. PvP052]
MNDSYRILKTMKENKGIRFALATIIRVDGSAYRREGAKMLFGEDGRRYGTISAGCLEEDLIHHAQEVIKFNTSKSVTYDLKSTDDFSWGQSAGCDGEIEVYIEAIVWEQDEWNHCTPVWSLIDRLLEGGKRIVSAKCVKGKDNQGTQFLYSHDGEMIWGKQDSNLNQNQKLVPYVKEILENRRNTKLIHIFDLESDFLFELFTPKESLYVFGAGPDAEPLVKLASSVDFSVTVIDPRSSRCTEENFPTADHRIIEHPETYLASTRLPSQSFVLVMTHNFNWDQKILQHFLHCPPAYLGVLGPRRRTERLIINKSLPDMIHSPIGINIGAEGPEEISISVMAELIQERNLSRKQKELNWV